MVTFLDLLIVVVMALAAVGLLATALMFLVKDRRVRRVCFYIVAGLGIYMGYVGARINWPGFLPQVVLAAALALTAVGSIVLEHRSGEDVKKSLTARLLASAAMLAGMYNAFC